MNNSSSQATIKPAVVVLAAGLGSRYGSLKQIDQFGPNGETIIDYSIYDAIRAGFGKAVFIIRKNIEEEFREVFVGKFENVIEIEYAFQEIDIVPEGITIPPERKKPWGTGHAVLMAADKISVPFAVINADNFYGKKSIRLLYEQLVKMDVERMAGCLIGYRLKNTLSDNGYVSRGICTVSDDNMLEKVTERTHIFKTEEGDVHYEENAKKYPLTGNELVSMNLLGFTPPFFDVLRKGFERFVVEHGNDIKAEYFLPSAVTDMITNYGVKMPVVETPESIVEATYKEDKPKVKAMINKAIEEGVYPSKLWQ